MDLPRFLLALPVLAFALATGCDEREPSEPLDLSALDERFACDDLTFGAATSDGEHALLVGIDDGLVAATLASGKPIESRYELPDERLTVRWVSGSNVYQGHCGHDSGETWELDERSDAVAGAIWIRVSPGPEPGPESGVNVGARIDARLEHVLLSHDDEPELYLERADFDDIRVD